MNSSRTLHILHLEDDPLDAELIHRAIASTGISCTFHLVDSRERFLAELNAMKFDVILSDNRLPNIDGIEALALVRHDDTITPFVFVSGWTDDPNHMQRLISLGATAFISKADMPSLAAWVKNLCKTTAAK